MGLLCLSRQNQQARKVCPVLHGWWCVLRLRIRQLCSGGLAALLPLPARLSLSLPFAGALRAFYLQGRARRTRTAPMIVYFGICLIARVAVCIFFTVFVVVGLFFFLPYFGFCFVSLPTLAFRVSQGVEC